MSCMVKLIIEPHADDAFLSLGSHIEKWNKEYRVEICTVFSGTRKRAVDASAYANAVKAKHHTLGYTEGIEDFIPDISEELYLELTTGKEVYLPLYLTHKEHEIVRDIFVNYRNKHKNCELLFYLDQPYALKQQNSDTINEYLNKYHLISYLVPNKRKLRHIPLFKDQSKFFYFEKSSIEKIIEMIFKEISQRDNLSKDN